MIMVVDNNVRFDSFNGMIPENDLQYCGSRDLCFAKFLRILQVRKARKGERIYLFLALFFLFELIIIHNFEH